MKLWCSSDIELFTAISVIPDCMVMKKGVGRSRNNKIISMAIKMIHKKKMNTEEKGKSNSCKK
jgi:hypothetical protein